MIDDPQELLGAMALTTRGAAERGLSPEGLELLRMIEFASAHSGMSVTDAWEEANANLRRGSSEISERDNYILVPYCARMELIAHFEKLLA